MSIAPGTVKICSLRQPVHAEYVVEAGADLFGLIFAEARRRVSAPVAREIVGQARKLRPDSGPRAVGVFVEQDANDINRIADEVGLDLVQLHRPEAIIGHRIERPAIVVVHATPQTAADAVTAQIAAIEASGTHVAGIAVDAFSANSHGGTGRVADWAIARELVRSFPVLLAGGLHPGNVAEAIQTVGPFGVDVSSGVETDGEKDLAKIIAFAQAARAAFAASVRQVDVVPLGQSAKPVERAQSLL
jgi:phosphoribosylanthranilate isomerase